MGSQPDASCHLPFVSTCSVVPKGSYDYFQCFLEAFFFFWSFHGSCPQDTVMCPTLHSHSHSAAPQARWQPQDAALYSGVNSGDFLILRKKMPREAPVASGINFCLTVTCKLAGRHTLACWSTAKLPRTSKGLLNQTAMNFCRNVMHSMCLRGWRRAGVV